MFAPEGKLPGIVHREAVRDVKFGISALGTQVEGVSRVWREENIVSNRNQRVRPVIDGVRINIGPLDGKAMRRSHGDVQLEREINGDGGGFEEFRVKKKAVVG